MKEDTAGRHLRLFSAPLKLGIHVSAVPLLETKVSVNQIDVVFSDIVLIAFRGCVEHSKKGTVIMGSPDCYRLTD